MAFELIAYSDLQKFMTLNKDDLTDYPSLDVLNGTLVSAFEVELGRLLERIERTVTIYVNDFKTKMIKLDGIPVTSVSSVTVSQRGDSESYTENEDYEVTEYGLRLWTKVQNCKLVIVYTGGLSSVSEAPGLNRAALYQLSYEFQVKDQIGAEYVSTDGGSVQRPPLKLLDETKRMLSPSKHPLHTG